MEITDQIDAFNQVRNDHGDRFSILNRFGFNLRNLIPDPCLFRAKEEELIKSSLTRKYKNNILLVGQPGVGKTCHFNYLSRFQTN